MNAANGAAGWREGVEIARGRMHERLNRLRQLTLRQDASLYASHPPSGLRHTLIASGPHRDPRVVLTEAECDRIDAELSKHERPYRLVIAESW